jgi:2,4-dienoyl-CoA reductase-like NADH-dependent reductase (Old Yellow Enzyme family)
LDRPGNVVISEDSDSPQRRSAFKKWTAAARRHGSLFIAQVYHVGILSYFLLMTLFFLVFLLMP